MAMTVKTVYLLRHAKSAWNRPELDDRDRPLSRRGLRHAPEMGGRMAQRGWRVDRIISSPAQRAVTTARLAGAELDHRPEAIAIDESLYFQGCRPMLSLLRRMPAELSSVMLVSHNPDITTLLNVLCDAHLDDIPTTALAVIEFSVEHWRALEEGEGRLVAYDFPKNPAKV